MHRPEREDDHSELYLEEEKRTKILLIAYPFLAVGLLAVIFLIGKYLPPTQAGGLATSVRETRGEESQFAEILIGTHNAERFTDIGEIAEALDEFIWKIVQVRGEIHEVIGPRVVLIRDIQNSDLERQVILPVVNLASPVFERVLDEASTVIAKGRLEPFDIEAIREHFFIDFSEAEQLLGFEGRPALLTSWTSSISR